MTSTRFLFQISGTHYYGGMATCDHLDYLLLSRATDEHGKLYTFGYLATTRPYTLARIQDLIPMANVRFAYSEQQFLIKYGRSLSDDYEEHYLLNGKINSYVNRYYLFVICLSLFISNYLLLKKELHLHTQTNLLKEKISEG